MVDANVLAQKLNELSRRADRVRAHLPTDPELLAEDQDRLDLLSFNLLLAVQSCVDIATHILSDERWNPAATARESLERLWEHGVISKATLDALRRAIGLRNVVAHGYAGVDPMLIETAARKGLPDLERFAAEVSAWLQGQEG